MSSRIGHLERENSINKTFIGHPGELCRTGHPERETITNRIFKDTLEYTAVSSRIGHLERKNSYQHNFLLDTLEKD
jgi:hypothetical protein